MLKQNVSAIRKSLQGWRRPTVIGVVVAAAAGPATTVDAAEVTIRVMTQNVYQGTNFDEVLAATTPLEFVQAVTTTYNNILATQPAERAAAVAREIAREKPDLVGLQEVATLLTGTGQGAATTVQFDYIKLLQADLTALGQSYSLIAQPLELVAQAPSAQGFNVRVERGNALLARTSDNATLTNVQTSPYANYSSLPTPVGVVVPDRRGLTSVDVTVGGATFRFATTHLDTSQPTQLEQMNELISSTSGATVPLIVAGDFNANASDPGDPTFATYQAAIDAGFVDAWSAAHPGDPGFTCCQAQNLLNTTSSLDQRIDLALLRGGIGVDDVHLVGDSDSDRTTPSGLWPADHAGLVATLEIPQRSMTVPETSTWVMTLLGFVGLGGWAARSRRTTARRACDRQASLGEVIPLRG